MQHRRRDLPGLCCGVGEDRPQALGHLDRQRVDPLCARDQAALRLLEKKSITLKFLPPYSPEINRIEKLWWLMKHRWMALPRRTKVELEQTVNHILTNQFKMAF